MNRKIRFAVIGCGHIGRRHAEMIFLNKDAELVALCDDSEDVKEGIAKYNAQFFTNLDDLLNADLSLDVINVATPNGLHAEMALKILNSGHHVVIEKPIALSKADAEQVIYTALHKGKQVFGVMQNRYSPPSVWLKDLVSSGMLGKINMVQINCYWNRDGRYYKDGNWHGSKTLDGGTLFTQFSHFIDVMYWLFGDIDNIHSRLKDFNHQDQTDFEDTGSVVFDFINGGTGIINFTTSCWDKNFESSMTIIAENGTIKVGGQYMNEVEYCHVKDYEMPELAPSNPPNDYGQYKGSAANHVYVIQNVIDVIKNGAAITTNALEGLKIVEIIERIYKKS